MQTLPARHRAFNDELRVPAETPIVGIVGVLARWKGQREFLQAAALVKQTGLNVRYVIVGTKNAQSRRRVPIPPALLPMLPAKIEGPMFPDGPETLDVDDLVRAADGPLQMLERKAPLGDASAFALRLQALYLFFKEHLMAARLNQDASKVDEVARLMRELRSAWGQIAGV